MINQEYKHAISIGSVTLVGYGGGEFPLRRGNCFSVSLQEGGWAQILNFNYENLRHLLHEKIVDFPIKIYMLNERHGLFCDSRIPDDYYSDDLCAVCTPKELLPAPQRVKQLIQIQKGLREEWENGIVTVRYPQTMTRTIPLKGESKIEEGYVYAPYVNDPWAHYCDEVMCDGKKCQDAYLARKEKEKQDGIS